MLMCNTGTYKITVIKGNMTLTASDAFNVVAPRVTGFSPSKGGPETQAVLTGDFKQNYSYSVYFSNHESYGYASQNNELITSVPHGTPAGNVSLSVAFSSNRVSATGQFTVVPPTIASFSPSSGVAGSIVTIKGDGFNPQEYYTSVTFGTIEAKIISITATEIQVQVPSNVTGAMKKR